MLRGLRHVAPWLLLAGVLLITRLWALDRLPGINGDEAWLAVQAQAALAGDPYLLRTPTHMFVNPLLLGSEALALAALPPSGWTLRLPIALWSLLALAAWARLHQRTYGARAEAWQSALLLGLLPLHVLYGRTAWDPSFTLVTMPFVFLPALKLADGRGTRADRVMLALGAFASLWIHLTAALPLFVLLLAHWLRQPRRRTEWLVLLALSLAFAVLLGCVGHVNFVAVGNLIERPLLTLSRPQELLPLVLLPGQLLWGGRALGYFAGMPEAAWTWLLSAVVLLWLAFGVRELRASAKPSDRLLARFALLLPIPWWVASGLLVQTAAGRERYVVWLLLPMLLVLLRTSLRTPERRLFFGSVSGAIAVLVLVASAQQWWSDGLARTLRTGPEEPKIAVARQLVAAANGRPLRVDVPDWWLEHPMRYLLPHGSVVDQRLAHATFRLDWSEFVPPNPACHQVRDGAGNPVLQWCSVEPSP